MATPRLRRIRFRPPDRPLESLERRDLLACAMPMNMAPAMMAEYQAAADLVDPAKATVTAVRDGNWSDPATWSTGAVPGAGADVSVPEGLTVTVDGVFPAPLHTVGTDGTIAFDPTRDTGLAVDTFVVTCCGTLQMGTAARPIAPGVKASITFVGTAPIDTSWDPRQLSRGLVSQGTVTIHGADVTPYVAVARTPRAGDADLLLASAPAGWSVGDSVVLTGTDPYNAADDERRTIAAVSGTTVTLDRPLAYDHATPAADLTAYVADLSRNVVLSSADPAHTWARGHVMFMHTDQESVVNAALVGLGRTDKTQRLNNPVLDSAGNLVPGTGANPVGRYALHVHRAGTDATRTPVLIQGSVVDGSPGWGFVNHSSNVDFEDDVAFNVVGAGFASEAGDEIGTFHGDLAIRSTGSGQGFGQRADNDLGHQGFGFWIQGGGVAVTDDLAFGQAGSGFLFWSRGLNEGTLGVMRFPAANLPDPTWAGGKPSVPVDTVPIRAFARNTAVASGDGLEWWNNLATNANPAAHSTIDAFTAWNLKADANHSTGAIMLRYVGDLTIRDARVVGNPAAPSRYATGIDGNPPTHDVDILNPDLDGLGKGVLVPGAGSTTIRGGYINAVNGVVVTPDINPNFRTVVVDDQVQFGTLSPTALAGATQLDVNMVPPVLDPTRRDFTYMLAGLERVQLAGKTLYFPQQAPGFVPFQPGAAPQGLPPQFLGLTNQQLWDQFGLATLGGLASAVTTTSPRVNALLGDTWDYPAVADIHSPLYTKSLTGYRLVTQDASGASVTDPTPVNLQAGWNLIPRTIAGQVRTFLVYGDVTPPTFTVATTQSMTLTAAQLQANKTFTIKGTVQDDSANDVATTLSFTNLAARPILTRPDGSRYIVLTARINDRAQNVTDLSFQVTIVP